MSPIDFPDLLEERGDATRGRRQSSRPLVSTLRSRSRSRSQARAQRRSTSCQPTERTRTAEEKLADKKKRRSLSKPPSKAASSRSLSRPSRTKESSSKEKKSSSKRVEVVNLTAKEPSPTKRRSTLKTSNSNQDKSGQTKTKDWSADIINLVDRDEEDFLLSEILSGKNPVIDPTGSSKKKAESKISHDKAVRSRSSSRPRKTPPSPTKKDPSPSKKEKYAAAPSSPSNINNAVGRSPKISPKSVAGFPNIHNKAPRAYSDDELSESESESEDEEEETNSVATNDLLDQVKSRMEQQRLMEEVKDLRKTIEKKDAEIEQLTGQLRMAISTKCDLVIAHTELERLHEMDLKQWDQYAEAMKRSNMSLMEVRAEVEKEFMNELNNLSSEVQESEEQRRKEAAEKDAVIRLMEEKVRRMELTAMGGVSARRDNDKVKYYKKKLGVYDQ